MENSVENMLTEAKVSGVNLEMISSFIPTPMLNNTTKFMS